MSGHGETPDDDDEEIDGSPEGISVGDTLYTEEGASVGKIRGMNESGIYVTVREGAEALTVEHARSGHEFGEAHLMWRCMNCGEMGPISGGLPDACPNCDADREDLMYWTED